METTPLPWTIESDSYLGEVYYSIREQNSPEERYANAEFMQRACNAHDDLLQACKLALSDLLGPQTMSKKAVTDFINEAICKAEGK